MATMSHNMMSQDENRNQNRNRETMSQESHTPSTARRVWTVIGATVSAVALVGGAFYLGSGYAFPRTSTQDTDNARSATSSQEVAQLSSSFYCPSRMVLADAGSYGDSDFQASEGNLTSTARMAVMGSLYQATVENINRENSSSLVGDSAMTDDSVHIVSGDDGASTVIQTRTLAAKEFTGATGTVASWASEADLRGISASSCVSFATSHSFLIPPTNTGWSQQLVIANSSDKAASVTLTAHNSQSSQEVTFETHATATVEAHSESVIDLSAAFTSDNPSYVTVESDSAPIAAVIRATHMNGLTPQGSEYIVPVNAAAVSQIIPGLSGAASAQLSLYSEQDGTATVTFLGENGELSSRTITYSAHQVSVTALDNLPQGAQSVMLSTTSPSVASVYSTASNGNGQNDFAMNVSQSAHSAYAVSVPENVNTRIDISNSSSSSQKARIVAFNADGSQAGDREVTINAHSVYTVNASDISTNAALIRISNSDSKARSSFVVGQSLSVNSLNDAHVAQRAVLTTPSMELQTTQYDVTRERTIVN